jgi:hypothetical protein
VSPRAWPKSKGTLTRQGTKRRLAHEAGISLHFYRQAVRVANIPTDEFERLVESDNPPTGETLANLVADAASAMLPAGRQDRARTAVAQGGRLK